MFNQKQYSRDYHRQYWKDLADKIKAKLKPQEGCHCCGVLGFLTIDHINPNDPKRLPHTHSEHLRIWRDQDFTNLQLLCYSCNVSKGNRKECLRHNPRPQIKIVPTVYDGYLKLLKKILAPT